MSNPSPNNSSNLARYVISGLLVIGIAVLLWIVIGDENHTEAAKRRLQERAREYAQLRLDDDWPELYMMVDPDQRAKKTRTDFLSLYGSGALKVHKMDFLEFAVSANKRVARTKYATLVELDKSKLPPIARGLQVPDPNALQKDGLLELDWVFKVTKETPKGDWYWKMGRQEATGRDPQGNPLIDLFDKSKKSDTPPPSAPGPDPAKSK